MELRRVMACSRWGTSSAAEGAGGRGHSALFLVSRSVCVCVCVRRCILTTVDPDTGVMSRKEPLDTLKR